MQGGVGCRVLFKSIGSDEFGLVTLSFSLQTRYYRRMHTVFEVPAPQGQLNKHAPYMIYKINYY